MHTESTRLQRFFLNIAYLRPVKLDVYIVKEVLSTFVGSSFFILFTLLMFQALRLLDFLIIHGAPATILLKMACYMGISFLPVVLPLSFLISILVAFSRFSSDSELVAMKACGISMPRIALSLLLPALAVAFLTMKLNLKWVPWGETASKRAEYKLGNTRAVTAIREGTFTTGFFDLLIFADKVDPKTNRMHRVFIFDEREANNPLTYVSKEAEIIPLKVESELGASIMLQLFDGNMHHSDLASHLYEKMDFDTYQLYLKVDEGNSEGQIYRLQALPQPELMEKIKTSDPQSFWGREYRGEYWRRYAVAMSPLIFVFLGIGFGTYRYRTARTGAVLTGFAVLIVYWVIQLMGITAMQRGTLPPPVAMQLPNIVMSIGAIFGFKRAAW